MEKEKEKEMEKEKEKENGPDPPNIGLLEMWLRPPLPTGQVFPK